MIYLKDFKENKRFMNLGPTKAKFDIFLLKSKKRIILSIFDQNNDGGVYIIV